MMRKRGYWKQQAEDEITEVIQAMSERYGSLQGPYSAGFIKTSRAAIRSDAAQNANYRT